MSTRSTILSSHHATLAETVDKLIARERGGGRVNHNRRNALRKLGGAGLLLPSLGAWGATCSVIPNETQGPYPGDGTNGPNALTQSGIVRSDIRSSFGAAGATQAAGVPTTLQLQLVNTNANCAGLAGYAIYAWHCDAVGRYSMYTSGVTTQNYLRGVQVTDSLGYAYFTTIFPGAYSGRWPHIHFEIYNSAAAATSGNNDVKTSQLALPEATCREVYTNASASYPQSLANLNGTPLQNDNVFSDGYASQLATVAAGGSVQTGYAASLQIGIVGPAVVANPAVLDIDRNGSVDALTDGIMILRYLFGLTGTALTSGAIGNSAGRTDPNDIFTYLESIRSQLDVDGNGSIDALTDGVLILRYIFGLRGDALVANAVGPNAQRSTAAAIEAYLAPLAASQ